MFEVTFVCQSSVIGVEVGQGRTTDEQYSVL